MADNATISHNLTTTGHASVDRVYVPIDAINAAEMPRLLHRFAGHAEPPVLTREKTTRVDSACTPSDRRFSSGASA